MKFFLTLLLAGSIALNALLAYFLLAAHSAAPAPITVSAPAVVPADTGPKIDANTWPALGGTDLPKLILQLRASGFPPALVRAIVGAQLDQEFAARRKALLASADASAFWKNPSSDPRLQGALTQLAREEDKLFRDLLGEDNADDPTARALQNRNLSFLPADKAAEIRRLMRDYDDKRADFYAAGIGYSTDRDKFAALEKDQHAAIARLLSPAELLDYDLRTSNTANNLRDSLSAFQPTEQEFRSIYQLQAAFDERFGQDFGLTLNADERRQRDDAQKLLTEQIKTALGSDRAAAYDKATDYNYRRTAQLVDRLDLPPATTDQLTAVQKEFQQRRMEIFQANPDATQRTQQLTALQQEAVARVTPILGTPGHVEAYKQYGGSWLQNLVPTRRPTAAAPARN